MSNHQCVPMGFSVEAMLSTISLLPEQYDTGKVDLGVGTRLKNTQTCAL